MERVVVTGLGVVSPLGSTPEDLFARLCAGRSGLRRLPSFAAAGLPATVGGPVVELAPDLLDREVEMSRRPIEAALAQAGLGAAQAGLLWATGLDTFAHRNGEVVECSAGDCFTRVARPFGRPRRLIATACASATQAIGEAYHLIRRRRARACVVGGATAMLTPFYVLGFSWLQALALDPPSPSAAAPASDDDALRACRPFDRTRRGFALGEGGAALVLETWESARARGAPILAEVLGYGCSQDAFELNRPPPDGAGAALCMRRALDDAGIDASALVAINAHGTGTRAGDPAEAAALRRLLGPGWRATPVSSVKGALGHLMAASGAVEALVAIATCRTGLVPPTCNLREPDEDCALDHVMGEARQVRPGPVLSSSFGMGGQNAAVIFARAPEAAS